MVMLHNLHFILLHLTPPPERVESLMLEAYRCLSHLELQDMAAECLERLCKYYVEMDRTKVHAYVYMHKVRDSDVTYVCNAMWMSYIIVYNIGIPWKYYEYQYHANSHAIIHMSSCTIKLDNRSPI